MATLSRRQSFPRRRESILEVLGNTESSTVDSRLRGNDCGWGVQITPAPNPKGVRFNDSCHVRGAYFGNDCAWGVQMTPPPNPKGVRTSVMFVKPTSARRAKDWPCGFMRQAAPASQESYNESLNCFKQQGQQPARYEISRECSHQAIRPLTCMMNSRRSSARTVSISGYFWSP